MAMPIVHPSTCQVNLLRERFVGPGRPPVVVLAHSIGERCARLEAAHESLQVDGRRMHCGSPLPALLLPVAPVARFVCPPCPVGCYMSIHAVHRLENHHLYSSQAATAAVDSVAQQRWEHPDEAAAAVDGSVAPGAPAVAVQQPDGWEGREEAVMQGMQDELVAERRRQQGQAGAPVSSAETSGSGCGSDTAAPSNVIKVVGLYPFLTGAARGRRLLLPPAQCACIGSGACDLQLLHGDQLHGGPVLLPLSSPPTLFHPPCSSLPAVDPDCSHQRRLSQLTRHHRLLSRLAGGVGALPFGLRRALVRLVAPQLDPHAVDTTVKGAYGASYNGQNAALLASGCCHIVAGKMRCCCPAQRLQLPGAHTSTPPPPPTAVFTSATAAENGLYMGLTEFETLAAPAQWWLLEALGPRFAIFVAPGDTWFKVGGAHPAVACCKEPLNSIGWAVLSLQTCCLLIFVECYCAQPLDPALHCPQLLPGTWCAEVEVAPDAQGGAWCGQPLGGHADACLLRVAGTVR